MHCHSAAQQGERDAFRVQELMRNVTLQVLRQSLLRTFAINFIANNRQAILFQMHPDLMTSSGDGVALDQG